MKTSIVYILRHAEAICNVKIEEEGKDSASPLTPTGIEQAITTGKWFKENNIMIDKIYTSEMERAIQTTKLLDMNKHIIIDKLLNERNIGEIKREMDGNRPIPIIKQFGLTSENHLLWSGPNGESQLQVIERVNYFLKNNSLNNSLIVTHGYVIDAIRSMFWGITNPTKYLDFFSLKDNYIRNCQIYKMILNSKFNFIKEESYYISNNQWHKIDFIFNQ